MHRNISTRFTVKPHLLDYEETCTNFSWDAIRHELTGLPDGKGLNIAFEAVDRHAQTDLANHLALRWLGNSDFVSDYSYADLSQQSNKFANVLQQLGVGKGAVVAAFSNRIPEVHCAALGTLKNGSIFCPLFSDYGTEPVYQRLHKGNAEVLVTTSRLYRQKIARIRGRLPHLRHLLLVDISGDLAEGIWSLPQKMSAASADFTIANTDPQDPALLHFTSGTTGMPKGVVHVHEAAVNLLMTGKYVLDFHPDDVCWCTADPGWVTGTLYGLFAPLIAGITNIVDSEPFDAERWFKTLESQNVSVWYTSPTAIRRLMRLEITPNKTFNLNCLRSVHTVGEPLNPESVYWGLKSLGTVIHDTWWQTETGSIMIANLLSMELRPGSMGRPVPGITAAVVRRAADNSVEIIHENNVYGELALRAGWPSMFRGYLHEEQRYRRCFKDNWYLTGDIVRRDADGYYWFAGRRDDIFKTAGHMVSPFEVESTLLSHPDVAEAGVVGKPDPMLGEIVKAYVALKPGRVVSDTLRQELLGFARKKLGPAIAPREIAFLVDLPKNRAGKIMRRTLKIHEEGLPAGAKTIME